MKTNMVFNRGMTSDWDCFGKFDTYSPLCRKRCALRLRCVVAREKIARMRYIKESDAGSFDEILEDIRTQSAESSVDARNVEA